MDKIEAKKMLEEIKNNHRILNDCSLHEFIEYTSPTELFKKYRCKNCGGIVGSTENSWYEKGMLHERNRSKA
jgi:hypothetical protein